MPCIKMPEFRVSYFCYHPPPPGPLLQLHCRGRQSLCLDGMPRKAWAWDPQQSAMALVWSALGSCYFTDLQEKYTRHIQGSLHIGACIRAKDLSWSQYCILCGSGLQCNQPETRKITTTKGIHNTQYLISSSPENFRFCVAFPLCCLLWQDRRPRSGGHPYFLGG